MSEVVTNEQLNNMTQYELEEGKKKDNLYNNPAPPMNQVPNGPNNADNTWYSQEQYSKGRLPLEKDWSDPDATTTTTIRQTTTTTTTSTSTTTTTTVI